MFGIQMVTVFRLPLYCDPHCIFKKKFLSTTQQDSSAKLGSGARDPRSSLNRARVLNPSSAQQIKNPSSDQQIKNPSFDQQIKNSSSGEEVQNLKNAYDIDCKTLGLSQVKNLLQMGRIIQNIYSGDLKSGLVWILNGLKEVGLEIV